MRRVLFILSVLVSVPSAAWSQGNPLGPEFRVNTYATGAQGFASAAADGSGNFVVAWTSLQDGSSYGSFGQRYASSGTPLGPEFRVNTFTGDFQGYPSVAADTSGNFVVAWISNLQDGSGTGVFGQRYLSSGTPVGPEFRINTYTTSEQRDPSVAADSSGNFVVTWQSFGQDAAVWGVFGQRYSSTGAPLGPEFRVNTFTIGNQYRPAVASDSLTGNFVVVWRSYQAASFGIFGQRYSSSGTPLGAEFRVNTYVVSPYANPISSIATDPSGNFVVVWENATDGSLLGVSGQRFASSGAPLGPEFRVNTYTTGHQNRPSVAADTSGNFVVTWESYGQDGASWGVFGQRYASTGAPLGPEFRVNTFTTSYQTDPSVAADSLGNFVVVWNSNLQDGSNLGVFGQRYSQIVPVELMHFRVE
jgi:hypothetical protein